MNQHFLAPIVLGLMALLTTSNALAQADLVKQKAQQLRDNNNAQPGVVAPAPAASVAAGPPAMPVPPPNPEQAKLVNRVASQLAALKPGVPATAEQKALLATNLLALSKVGTKPTKDLLNKLSGDLAAALSEKTFSTHDLQVLSMQINVVMNSSSLKASVAQTYILNAAKLLKAGNVSPTAVKAVTADLTAIVTALQKDKPKLYQ